MPLILMPDTEYECENCSRSFSWSPYCEVCAESFENTLQEIYKELCYYDEEDEDTGGIVYKIKRMIEESRVKLDD